MGVNQFILSFIFALLISICIYCKPAKSDENEIINDDDESLGLFVSQSIDSLDRETKSLLAHYFKKYRYSDTYTVNVNDLRASIKNFQYLGGLLPTGKLDSATFDLLKKDRCGLLDPPVVAGKRRRYRKQGTTWRKRELTWTYHHNLHGNNGRRIDEIQILPVLKRAINMWEKVTRIRFVYINADDPVDINIGFYSRRHARDPYEFDGPGGTIAHAFYPLIQTGLAGDVHFDDDEYFTLYGEDGGISLFWTAVHELGHTLGLDHSRTQSAIMYPFYRSHKEVKLDYDDIKGIQSIYGKRTKPDSKPVPTKQPEREILLNNRCPRGKITAAWNYLPFKSYMLMTEDERLYTVYKNGTGIINPNIEAKAYYRAIPEKIDAIYQTNFGDNSKPNPMIYDIIFAGKIYYVYKGFTQVSGPHPFDPSIGPVKIPRNLERIDAAFKWWQNKKVYFFSGGQYWRYNEATKSVDPGYPRAISLGWNGLPGKVDSACCSYKPQETFFTIGDKIYRMEETPKDHMEETPQTIRLKPGYPKSIKTDLLVCNDV